MAKRSTGLGRNKKSRSKKTQKRIVAKYERIAQRSKTTKRKAS